MYIKKTERGCKMLTLQTEMVHELVFKDYSNAKNFINGFVAYSLSQAVIRVTSQDFGVTSDVTGLIAIENRKYHEAFKQFLTTQEIESAFFYYVMQYTNSNLVEKPAIETRSADNILAKRQIDFMEYMSAPLEEFFNELVARVSHKFSNYEGKLVLVNADLATPGLLVVSYKTVIRTPQLLLEYQ